MQKYVENIKSDNFLYEFSFSRKLIVKLYALENSDLMCFFFLFTVTSIQKLIKLLLLKKKMSVKKILYQKNRFSRKQSP